MYKELLHLQITTGWEGLVVLRSKERNKIVYGATDKELEKKFLQSEALVENVDARSKISFKKVDMSQVMLQLSKTSKRFQPVPESPVVSPSKMPDCVQEMLPKTTSLSKQQASSLGDISMEQSDKQCEFSTPVGSFLKRKLK